MAHLALVLEPDVEGVLRDLHRALVVPPCVELLGNVVRVFVAALKHIGGLQCIVARLGFPFGELIDVVRGLPAFSDRRLQDLGARETVKREEMFLCHEVGAVARDGDPDVDHHVSQDEVLCARKFEPAVLYHRVEQLLHLAHLIAGAELLQERLLHPRTDVHAVRVREEEAGNQVHHGPEVILEAL